MTDAYKQGQIDLLRAQIAGLQAQLDELLIEPRAAFAVDKRFDAAAWVDDVWYARLTGMIGAGKALYPNPEANLAGAGMANGSYVRAAAKDWTVYMLGWALDSTGDPALLDEMARLMGMIDHARLIGADDLHESHLVALMAFYTLALMRGERLDAIEWLMKLTTRIDGRGGVLACNGNLSQSWLASIFSAWCLWLLTENEKWKVEAEARRERFYRDFVYDRAAGLYWRYENDSYLDYAEDWRTGAPLGAEHTDYARYGMYWMVALERLGFTVIPAEVLAGVAAGMIRADGRMSNRIDGTGEWNKPIGLLISSYSLLGRWHTTVTARSAALWEASAERDRLPFVPAALVAEARQTR